MSSPDLGRLLKDVVDTANDLAVITAHRMGVGVTDLRAVDVLLEHGPLGPNDLGRRLGLTAPAATALADRLERNGHADRVRDPDDRRRVALVPTEKAREDAYAALGAFLRDVEALTGALGDRERRAVARFLAATVEIQREHAR